MDVNMIQGTTRIALRLTGKVLGFGLVLTAVASQAHAAASIPEIDPGSISAGVTLVAGALMLLNSRRRSK